MRKNLILLLALLTITLTSCLDSVEELTIAADGSGVYKNTINISGLFDMMGAMNNTQEGDSMRISDQPIDSTIMMRTMVDTATDLTAEQKKLFHDAVVNVKIEPKDKAFKVAMTYPFKKLKDVQEIIALSEKRKGSGMLGLNKPEEGDLPAMGNFDGLASISKYFDLNYKKGLLERKINQQFMDQVKSQDKLSEMESLASLLESMKFRTVINLPVAAKKASGEKLSLSSDKRTVTIETNMYDFITNPQALAFRIEY